MRDSGNPCILLPIMDAAALAAEVARSLLPQLKSGGELPEPARQLWAEIAARPALKEAALADDEAAFQDTLLQALNSDLTFAATLTSLAQGGITLEQGAQLTVGSGDVTGRDKYEAGSSVFHAESGSTLIVNIDSAPSAQSPREASNLKSPVADANLQRSAANPFYTSGRINDPTQFFGRAQLVREIRAELKKRSSVSIVGDSETGKSSLLYYLYATRAEWLPGLTLEYVDLQRVLDEADFCETVLARLGVQGDTLRQLKKVLESREVVLLFDEVERLAEQDFNPRLHDLLRSLAQEQGKLTMGLVTQHPLETVFPARTPGGVSPFHNIFTRKFIGPFAEAEARAFLASRLEGASIAFTPPEIERLLAESAYHPAKLQRLAKALFEEKADVSDNGLRFARNG